MLAFFLFQVVFMETAGYIIIGAIAERISFAGFIFAEIAMGAIIYPIYGNWVWGGGWLAHLGQSLHLGHGAVDFAGSGVVHATGGWAALALAMMLGPRIGKYRKDGIGPGVPRAQPRLRRDRHAGARRSAGWASTPARRSAPPTCASASSPSTRCSPACAGAVMAMAWTNWKWGKPDISMTCNGMLAGLVAITAPCAFVAPWAAIVIGIIAGFLVCWSVEFFDQKAPDRRPVRRDLGARHVRRCGACSRSGSSPTARTAIGWNGCRPRCTACKGIFYGDAGQLGAQVIDVVVGFIWAWGVMYDPLPDRHALREDAGRRPRSRSPVSTKASSVRSATRTS